MPIRIIVCFLFLISAANAAYAQKTSCDAFDQGADHRHAGRWDEAIAALTKAIDLKCPEIGQAYYLRGEARWGKKDYDGAWADATKAIPLLDERGAGNRLRGQIASAKGDFNTALSEFSKAVELDPTDMLAYTYRAEARVSLGDLDGAIAEYTRLIQVEGSDLPLHIARAKVYLAKGDKVMAFADFDKAIAILPNQPNSYVSRGHAHLLFKDFKAAEIDLKIALAMSPRNVDAHHYLGHVYHDQQLYSEAAASFSSAIKEAPTTAGYYVDRGLVYRDQVDFERAEIDLAKALKLDYGNADLHLSMAWISLLRRNFDQAQAHASEALSRAGMNGSEPYGGVVEYLALRMNGKPAEASAKVKPRIKTSTPATWTDSVLKFLDGQLTAAQFLTAAKDDEQRSQARSIIGTKAIIDGRPAAAKPHLAWINANGVKQSFEYSFFRLLSEGGASPAASALFAQGTDHFNEGRNAEAIAAYTKAIAADPKRPEYLLARAKVNILLRKLVPARQDIDRSLQIGARYEAYALSANMHIEGGRFAQALTDLETGFSHRKGFQNVTAVFNHHAALAGVNALLGKTAEVKSNIAIAEQAMGFFSDTQYDFSKDDKASGLYGLALAKFSAAIADRPDRTEFLAERGLVWIELGKLKEALGDFDKALAVQPKQIYIQIYRGKTLVLMKRYAEALTAVDIALDALPVDDPMRMEANEVRAAANCALGNKAEAGIDEAIVKDLGGTIKTPCR